MDSTKLISALLSPISTSFAVMIMLLGLYSITFNVADAKYKNHPRAEKTAFFGGWLYIIGGTALLVQQWFSG